MVPGFNRAQSIWLVSPPWCWGLRWKIEGCSLTNLVFGWNCAYSKEPLVCLSHRASPACHLPSRRFRVLRVQVPRERDRWNQITFYDVASEASSSLPITFYCEDKYAGMPGLEAGTRTLPLNGELAALHQKGSMENGKCKNATISGKCILPHFPGIPAGGRMHLCSS